MPSGDAQRVWFPEMLDDLRATWSPSMSWPEVVVFCRQMTDKRRVIREVLGIRGPRFRCPRCGTTSRSNELRVSVRSLLFTLRKLGVVTNDELKVLDRSWKKHRVTASVDAYGQPIDLDDNIQAPRGDCC